LAFPPTVVDGPSPSLRLLSPLPSPLPRPSRPPSRSAVLQVSNNKLFYRSIGIISKFSNTGDATSRLALLRSLHRTDEVGAEIEGLGISAHIRASGECVAQGIRVVPTAIILATKPSLTFAEASAVLAAEPQLGAALGEL